MPVVTMSGTIASGAREVRSVEDAERRLQESDRARAGFYRKFWKVEYIDPSLYDITLETSRLSYEAGAELVVAAARSVAAAA